MGYNEDAVELRDSIDGSLIKHLRGIQGIEFSPDPENNFLVILNEEIKTSEIRKTKDGSLIKKLSGAVSHTTSYYLSEEDKSYLLINYYGRPAEVWSFHKVPVHLTSVFLSSGPIYMTSNPSRFIFSDSRTKQVGFIDLTWLEAMGGYPVQLKGDKLIKAACIPFHRENGIFTTEDETRLIEEYLRPLGIGELRAC